MIRRPPRSTRTNTLLPYTTLFRSTRQIFLIRSDGGGLRQLTSPPGHHEGPVWSPDGRTLSFVRTDSRGTQRSEEHTSELQSLMRISYAVFCLKKKKLTTAQYNRT